MARKKPWYVIVSEGVFLVNAAKALNGEGLKGEAYTSDLSKAKSYSSRKDAARVASSLYRAVPYRVKEKDLLTAEGLSVGGGDKLISRYVGECRVERIIQPSADQFVTWVSVSYDAYVFAKKANETLRRIDPVGVGPDGIAYFTRA